MQAIPEQATPAYPYDILDNFILLSARRRKIGDEPAKLWENLTVKNHPTSIVISAHTNRVPFRCADNLPSSRFEKRSLKNKYINFGNFEFRNMPSLHLSKKVSFIIKKKIVLNLVGIVHWKKEWLPMSEEFEKIISWIIEWLRFLIIQSEEQQADQF
jgi:hypothetical protein